MLEVYTDLVLSLRQLGADILPFNIVMAVLKVWLIEQIKGQNSYSNNT